MLRGLSQIELALRSGLSRTQLHKLERGEVQNPTAGTVHSLAQELKVPASYLATAPGPVPPEESLHCRAKMNRPVRVLEELQVRGEHFRRLMTHLEGYIQPPAVHIPERRASGTPAIELAAEACRVDWGLRVDNPIANMTRLLERAGAFVGLFRHDGEVVDAFSWWEGRPYILSKRNSDSATRRRHSLAHELGHLVLHRRISTGDRVTEDEANRFAGAFLLPAAALKREFPRSRRIDWDGLIEMKQRWGVSIQAILYRAHDIGLITPAMYRSAYVRISQLGWRKEEPGEPEPEVPEFVRTIVDRLRERGVTEHSLAQALGFDVKLLEDAAGVSLRDLSVASSQAAILNFPGRRSPTGWDWGSGARGDDSDISPFAKLLAPLLAGGQQTAPPAAAAPGKTPDPSSPFAKLLAPLLADAAPPDGAGDVVSRGVETAHPADAGRTPDRGSTFAKLLGLINGEE